MREAVGQRLLFPRASYYAAGKYGPGRGWPRPVFLWFGLEKMQTAPGRLAGACLLAASLGSACACLRLKEVFADSATTMQIRGLITAFCIHISLFTCPNSSLHFIFCLVNSSSFRTAFGVTALAFAGLLANCSSPADKPTGEVGSAATTAPASGAVTHAQLVADHQKMEADHRIMQSADSVMEADHQQAVAAGKAAGIASTPAFQDLEKRHDALIKEHQEVIARHDAVLKRHAELEQQHQNGRVSDEQMQQDHATMKAEDQQIQQEHKKLVDDHAEMMAEHKALLAKAGKA